MQHPHLPGRGWRGGPRHAGRPHRRSWPLCGELGRGCSPWQGPASEVCRVLAPGPDPVPPSHTISAGSTRPQGAGGGCRSPPRCTDGLAQEVGLPERGGVHTRTATRGNEGTGATSHSQRGPPEDRSPRDAASSGPPCASSCPSVCPGIGYPLFPSGSLNRALATKTPPPLYLGAEGRRGEAHSSLASSRSGGSAAVSAGGGTPWLCGICLG